jgi:mRNA-degrading endonuclease toxin of MazEF toxin-antitoxin module
MDTMDKFNRWNELKKKTEDNRRKLGIKPRDIFWTKVGQNIGSEEYGKSDNFARPVIIIRKLTHDLFIGIPLTRTIKVNDYFHSFEYNNKSNGLTKNSAMILQVRTFSIKRLMNKTGVIGKEDFEVVIEKSKRLFSPT